MSKIKERICSPDAHRAVNWNEKAVQKVIDTHGYVLAGVKVDGMRCHALYDPLDGVRFVTREGIEIKSLEHQRAYFTIHWERVWGLHKDLVLDFEVYVPGVSFQEGCGLLRREAPLARKPQFVALDILHRDRLLGKDAAKVADFVEPPFFARHSALIAKFPHILGSLGSESQLVVVEPLAKCLSIDAVKMTYNTARGLGYEGLICKDPKLAPRNGKVAGQWKLKPGGGMPGWEGDGKIVGYVWGDDAKANSGMIVGFRVLLENGQECNATGLTQDQMRAYTSEYEQWKNIANPYIGRYAQVEAMEQTDGGSLRHPKFVRFRDLEYAPGIKS